jgi:hypothetical protein
VSDIGLNFPAWSYPLLIWFTSPALAILGAALGGFFGARIRVRHRAIPMVLLAFVGSQALPLGAIFWRDSFDGTGGGGVTRLVSIVFVAAAGFLAVYLFQRRKRA